MLTGVAFHVLFVCTGNICRSPMAERLLDMRMRERGLAGVDAASAGTRAMVGYGMDVDSAHVLRTLGADSDGHVARQLTRDMTSVADLVLTSTTAHRASVVKLDPSAMRRTFTMREFARLGGSADVGPDDGLVDRVAAVAARRGHAEPAEPGADDIADPYGAPIQVMTERAHEVAEAVDGILQVLLPRSFG